MERQLLFENFARGNSEAFQNLWKEYYPYTKGCVPDFPMSLELKKDIEDVLQEALLALWAKMNHPDVEIRSIDKYLKGIIRNEWRKKFKENARYRGISDINEESEEDNSAILSYVNEANEYKEAMKLSAYIIDDVFQVMGQGRSKDCVDIIKDRFMLKATVNSLAEEHGKTPGYLKQLRKRCLEYIHKGIKKHILFPRIKKYINNWSL